MDIKEDIHDFYPILCVLFLEIKKNKKRKRRSTKLKMVLTEKTIERDILCGLHTDQITC